MRGRRELLDRPGPLRQVGQLVRDPKRRSRRGRRQAVPHPGLERVPDQLVVTQRPGVAERLLDQGLPRPVTGVRQGAAQPGQSPDAGGVGRVERAHLQLVGEHLRRVGPRRPGPPADRLVADGTEKATRAAPVPGDLLVEVP